MGFLQNKMFDKYMTNTGCNDTTAALALVATSHLGRQAYATRQEYKEINKCSFEFVRLAKNIRDPEALLALSRVYVRSYMYIAIKYGDHFSAEIFSKAIVDSVQFGESSEALSEWIDLVEEPEDLDDALFFNTKLSVDDLNRMLDDVKESIEQADRYKERD